MCLPLSAAQPTKAPRLDTAHTHLVPMQLHRCPPRTKCSATMGLPTSPCRCWGQCACRPPSQSSGRCRSVGGRAGCAAQAWRRQVRGKLRESVRPDGACDKGAVMRQGMMAPVDGIVHPPAALLHAYAAPLRIIQQPPLGCSLGNVLGQDDVTAQHAERERVS